MAYEKPAKWKDSSVKLFPYQVGFTAPPHDFDAAPSDFLRMAPRTVGVHGRMLHVPDYAHKLDQRQKNFGLLEEFVECMANNGADVCAQVGSNWVHASGLGVEGIRNHCAMLSDRYETPFHMAGYAMVEALRDQNVEKVALTPAITIEAGIKARLGSCRRQALMWFGRVILSIKDGLTHRLTSTAVCGASMNLCSGIRLITSRIRPRTSMLISSMV